MLNGLLLRVTFCIHLPQQNIRTLSVKYSGYIKLMNTSFFRHCIVLFTFLLFVADSLAQKESVFVKYKNYNDTIVYLDQWFTSTHTIITYSNALNPRSFNTMSILDKDGTITTQDTTKYKEDFERFSKMWEEYFKKKRYAVISRKHGADEIEKMVFDAIENKYYIVDTISPMSEWKILDDTATLLGFKCQKAITNYYGSEYYAWFTTDVGLAGGPLYFRGLPGIILKIWNKGNLKLGYEALEVEFPAIKPEPIVEKDGKHVTKREFRKLIEESNKKALEGL